MAWLLGATSLTSMMYGNHMNGGGWALSILVTLVIVAMIVIAVIWLRRSLDDSARRRDSGAESGSARELLDRRVAGGEITPEEYQRLRKTLSDTPPKEQQAKQPAGTVS